MEFLKKHYEKIALAVVSLMMIATALTLVNRLGFDGSEPPDITTNRSAATPLDTNELMQVATLLKNPPSWRTNDGPRPFIPEPWNWNGKELFPATEPPPTPVVAGDPADELQWWMASRTFPMKFMSVVSGVGTNKVFQINPGMGTRFVKIGDPPIRQSIYGTMEEFTVLRYEEKKVEWFNPAIGAKTVTDVSVLTLQRKSAGVTKEIPLVIGKQVLESEPVARYHSSTTGEWSGDLKKGSKFNYKGKTYELVRLDINPPQLIFKDVQTQKEYRRRPRVVQRF
ncbi:MAG: hypothetical protein A2107_14860 [Verrucomicrobia bacterium GWF2_62_7]|nr:MAG: hypothetical protein A2107_14860 [Verrucomicrobia bacterium GWF2_62_7]